MPDNLTTFTDLAKGVDGTELVVEAATENIDLKLNIFKQLDSLAPANAMLATNTSSISITVLLLLPNAPAR